MQGPLDELADIRFVEGPPMIKSENGWLNGLAYIVLLVVPVVYSLWREWQMRRGG